MADDLTGVKGLELPDKADPVRPTAGHLSIATMT